MLRQDRVVKAVSGMGSVLAASLCAEGRRLRCQGEKAWRTEPNVVVSSSGAIVASERDTKRDKNRGI
jgi:hypothetical protein